MGSFICPNCKSTSYSVMIPYRGSAPGFIKKKIMRCFQCDLYSIYPMPAEVELENYYKTYWIGHDEADLFPLFEAQARARYSFIAPFLPRISNLQILDVGSGYGLIRNAFPSPIVYDTVEVDPKAIEYLKAIIQPANIYSHSKDITKTYHILILSHILEHLTQPLEFLCEQKKNLVSGGLMFIEVPNKDFVYKFRNEPHLIFFEPKTLLRMVELAGLQILQINTCGREISELTSAPSMRLLSFKTFLKRILPRQLIKRIRRKKIQKPYETLMRQVAEYGQNRQWIRLVAIKP